MLRGLRVFVLGMALAGSTLAGVAVAAAQEPAKPVLPMEGDAAVLIILIKPDKTAEFESCDREAARKHLPRATSPCASSSLPA